MPPSYMVNIYDTAGVKQATLGLENDVRSLVIEHQVNYVSTLTLGLWLGSYAVPFFTLDALVEVRRRVPEAGLDWYTEFIGFHRTPQKEITEADSRIFTSYSRGLLDLVKRSEILYYADTVGSAKGPATADDIIKAFVRENAGSLATVANARVRAHIMSGLAVDPDTSQAASIETANAWQNLLDAIRNIGEANSVDFDVAWGGAAAPLTFTFKTYYPQLGTDRREGTANPQVFAPELGNMRNPSHTLQRSEEVSVAAVLGPGEGPLRDVTIRTSTHTADSPWNDIEQAVNASGEDRTVALDQLGDQLLYEKRPAISMPFQVIQTAQSTYGKHYFLGDLVTGTFEGASTDVKIKSATISLADQRETISLGLEEVA